MTTELIIHLEASDDGEAVWWGESPAVEGFYAVASTLADLRERATKALSEVVGTPVRLVERLAGDVAGDAIVAKANLSPC